MTCFSQLRSKRKQKREAAAVWTNGFGFGVKG